MSRPRSSRPPLPARRVAIAAAVGLAATLFIAWPLTAVLLYTGVIQHEYGGRFPVDTASGLASITLSRHVLSDAYQLRLVQPEDSFLPLGDPAPLPRWVAVPAGPDPSLVYVDTGASGWPLRCFASESWQRRTNSGTATSPQYAWREELRHNILLATTPRGRVFLPLRPIWTGLAGDTLILGAGAWLGMVAATGLRSRLRQRRGACVGCGYDLCATPPGRPCSECGRPAPPRDTPAPRSRSRLAAWILLTSALIVVCAAWVAGVQPLTLLALRELLRLGERVGITASAALGRGSLAGQILGFNYSRPPLWYDLGAHAAAIAFSVAPALVAALAIHRRARSSDRLVTTTWSRAFASLALPVLLAGVVIAVLDRWLGTWLWLRLVELGESLGGTAPRISGALLMTPAGPFTGTGAADSLSNAMVRYGPAFFLAIPALAAAFALHSLLWRYAGRVDARFCPGCGYDLRATPTDRPCPECGRLPPSAPSPPPVPVSPPAR